MKPRGSGLFRPDGLENDWWGQGTVENVDTCESRVWDRFGRGSLSCISRVRPVLFNDFWTESFFFFFFLSAIIIIGKFCHVIVGSVSGARNCSGKGWQRSTHCREGTQMENGRVPDDFTSTAYTTASTTALKSFFLKKKKEKKSPEIFLNKLQKQKGFVLIR